MFYLLLAIHLNLIIYISLLERAFEVLDDVLDFELAVHIYRCSDASVAKLELINVVVVRND